MTEKGLETADLDQQIDHLTEFIMAEVPGEPSQSEGAVDCAIRIIRTLLAERAALRDAGWVDPEEAAKREQYHQVDVENAAKWHAERDEARATKDMHKERAQQAIAERDALLLVVEAARTLVRRTDEPNLPAEELSRLLLTLTAAVDLWESRKETP